MSAHPETPGKPGPAPEIPSPPPPTVEPPTGPEVRPPHDPHNTPMPPELPPGGSPIEVPETHPVEGS